MTVTSLPQAPGCAAVPSPDTVRRRGHLSLVPALPRPVLTRADIRNLLGVVNLPDCPSWCAGHLPGAADGGHHSGYKSVSLAAVESGDNDPGLVEVGVVQKPGQPAVVSVVAFTDPDDYMPEMTPDEADELARVLTERAAAARNGGAR